LWPASFNTIERSAPENSRSSAGPSGVKVWSRAGPGRWPCPGRRPARACAPGCRRVRLRLACRQHRRHLQGSSGPCAKVGFRRQPCRAWDCAPAPRAAAFCPDGRHHLPDRGPGALAGHVRAASVAADFPGDRLENLPEPYPRQQPEAASPYRRGLFKASPHLLYPALFIQADISSSCSIFAGSSSIPTPGPVGSSIEPFFGMT
jgi:hypothetical protein